MSNENELVSTNFIEAIINEDIENGQTEIVTRFPPEPNGYLHIGHAKSIFLNFGLAKKYGGTCHLRFDDTNPQKEEEEYIEAIERDVRWLGGEWDGEVRYASNYFEHFYEGAVALIERGLAYVDDSTAEELRAMRGTLTEPGTESPYRNRSVEENLDLFRRMKEGEFAPGSRILRAKIDMASSNMNMRELATPGTSIRCTILPIRWRTRSRASPTRSAPLSLRTTARFTTGCWTICAICRSSNSAAARLNLPAWRSKTLSPPSASSRRWWTLALSMAGTIHACQPSPGCAVAATRRQRWRISASASASRRRTAASKQAISCTACARI